jgi:hypothetical protein
MVGWINKFVYERSITHLSHAQNVEAVLLLTLRFGEFYFSSKCVAELLSLANNIAIGFC